MKTVGHIILVVIITLAIEELIYFLIEKAKENKPKKKAVRPGTFEVIHRD